MTKSKFIPDERQKKILEMIKIAGKGDTPHERADGYLKVLNFIIDEIKIEVKK